jgi:hypothetical protein
MSLKWANMGKKWLNWDCLGCHGSIAASAGLIDRLAPAKERQGLWPLRFLDVADTLSAYIYI